MFWKAKIQKSPDSFVGLGFDRHDDFLRRLEKSQSVSFTIHEAHFNRTGIHYIKSIDDHPWRLIGRSNTEHVFMEMEGEYRGDESVGEIVFESELCGQPRSITGLVNIREDLFRSLWNAFVSDASSVFRIEIRFSGDPWGMERLPVKDITVRKSIKRP